MHVGGLAIFLTSSRPGPVLSLCNSLCGNVVKTLGPSKKVYTSSLGWERAALPSLPASGCGQAAEFIYGKQKRPPGSAPPGRASESLVRRRICQRGAGGLWSPRVHRTAYWELIAPLIDYRSDNAKRRLASSPLYPNRPPPCQAQTATPTIAPGYQNQTLPTSLVHVLYMPPHPFVLGHPRRVTKGVYIVG
jgi:hypothetical protein